MNIKATTSSPREGVPPRMGLPAYSGLTCHMHAPTCQCPCFFGQTGYGTTLEIFAAPLEVLSRFAYQAGWEYEQDKEL